MKRIIPTSWLGVMLAALVLPGMGTELRREVIPLSQRKTSAR